MALEQLLAKISSYTENPNIELVKKAYYFAKDAHEGQYRVSGEPFVSHPLQVAKIMAELELDVISIAAAILHDVVEDTEVTAEELREEFGPEVELLVNGVTKLSKIDFKSREEHQAESLRKMFLAMAKDIRVILIKLADRLHNMRTLKYLPKEKKIIKATETLEIYAPLAHRLGISHLKWELEDLSFRYLEPNHYYELARKVAKNRAEREAYIENIISTLNDKLKEVDIEADLYGRPKHLYSIYQKMIKYGKEFKEIYDLTALRVIVTSVKECYQVLGIIHELWNPMPGRIKDYVAMPKSNMYQSLHTTVIGPKGEPLEIQIRTWEMHRTAEYGIAAHWRYKEGNKKDEDFERKISWLRQLLEWQKDLNDAKEFMENLKIDLFEDEVFVFTPKGDVISLPYGASPVDFAYNIHTDIGHTCVGAKVNGKIIPLEYRLKNGDIIEILTSNNSGPSRDWLNFVKTSRAKSKIKHWFKEQRKEESSIKGKEMLESRLKKENFTLKEAEKTKKLEEIAKKLGVANVEGLYAGIGYNKFSVSQVVKRLIPPEKQDCPEYELDKLRKKRIIKRKRQNKGIKVKGMDGLLVRISKCCNPVPGDDIVGYITRGRGVSVHRGDCPNLKNLEETEEERIVGVEWYVDQQTSYEVELKIEAWNKHSLLNDVTTVISEAKVNITSINARATKNLLAYINLSLEISSLEHMKDIIRKLEDIDGVLNVQRANPA
ncbi:(p)ppGpp synthetase [Orenia metallireducens]|jgi:GTP pyrophosphokinase|uniref:GTP diphosphokinase n=1 Tax=Orenia metallireducens TaxID=1413210 RepID=A0A1C0A4U3_9FIRM|nr:bifunctional (p)ppGpp synthetase/guanosine-3',5'-bis(diphosphate) 3'-pyrophosphohydrolase [Orenia metallireducens]OCL25145.1 (p)ppGpp synthetase [Orenia metallireducens]